MRAYRCRHWRRRRERVGRGGVGEKPSEGFAPTGPGLTKSSSYPLYTCSTLAPKEQHHEIRRSLVFWTSGLFAGTTLGKDFRILRGPRSPGCNSPWARTSAFCGDRDHRAATVCNG